MRYVQRSAFLLLAAAVGCSSGTTAPDLGFLVQAIGTPPTTAVAGTTVQVAAKVLHRESGGGTTPVSGKAITLTVTAGGGTVNGATTATVTTAADGSASAAWQLGSTVGPQTLRASVSATEFLDFTIAATAPPATQLALATPPSSNALSGAALAQQPAIQLKDANGNNVTQAAVQVTATIETGGGTLAGTQTVATNASGLATFTDLAISGVIGNRTLKFTATLAGGAVSVSSGTIALAAGAAAQITVATQPSSTTPTGFTLLQQAAIQLRDDAGNIAAQAGVVVTVSVATGEAKLLGTLTAMTNANGVATFTNVGLYGKTGPTTLSLAATLGSQSRTATSSAIAVTLPGNGKIVFKSTSDAIWTVNPDGTGLAQLTPGYGSSSCQSGDEEPKWSPDGTKIVFSRTDAGSQEVWVMNADGSHQIKLTNDGDANCTNNPAASTFSENPSWSPDGTKIIFTSDRSTTAFDEDLWIMNADGSGQTKLFGAAGMSESEAFFSPDGQTIAFQLAVVNLGAACDGGDEEGNEIWLMRADGTNPKRLTTLTGCSFDENLTWSADGAKIAYTHGGTGAALTCFDEVFIINVDGTNPTKLTNCFAGNGSERPGFAPNGTKIVFANGSGSDSIWLMDPDGSNQAAINLGNVVSSGQPRWQPVRP